MPIPITMPALSPTMTEGNLAKWLKGEGDQVVPGDVIAEIETDKATMEVEAVDEGVLAKILINEGTEGVAVNSVIALLLEEGEGDGALADFQASSPEPAAHALDPDPEHAAAPVPPPEPAAAPVPPPPELLPAAAPVTVADEGGRVKASPLARRMAQQANIDLATVNGSGPHGRVVKVDIQAALGKVRAAAAGPAVLPVAAAMAAPGQAPMEIPHTNMRKVIARRLTEAKREIPHFYLSLDCEVDKLLELRKTLNAKAKAEDLGYKLSVNDFVIRAAALALRKIPDVNVSWTDDALLKHNVVDLSIAVSIAGGLITPIIRNADQKGLATISNEMRELAGRAREGKLMPEEYQGGTFSISNLGMFGISEFAAVINPPQSAIIAVGRSQERPVVKDGALAIATIMTVTLSVDHRTVDGALGAQYLNAFQGLIEDPLTMLL